jgi:hypothetical protein
LLSFSSYHKHFISLCSINLYHTIHAHIHTYTHTHTSFSTFDFVSYLNNYRTYFTRHYFKSLTLLVVHFPNGSFSLENNGFGFLICLGTTTEELSIFFFVLSECIVTFFPKNIRCIFFALFILSVKQILLTSDWWPLITMIVFAFTNGYFGSTSQSSITTKTLVKREVKRFC